MMEGFPDRSLVVLNLVNPREKFWGVLLSLSPVGITLRGINLDAFEDWVRQLTREGEQGLEPATVFVPLFRVERLFLDEPVGSVQSYSQFFEQRVGVSPVDFIGLDQK